MKIPHFLKNIFVFICVLGTNISYANNIQITNISLLKKNAVEDYVYVQFDISWENSWRLSTAPGNWDAAWVFIKYRVNSGEWHHASLSNLDADHVAPAGAVADASNDGKGAFLYRASDGSGNISWTGVQLKWLYGTDGVADNAANLEVRVFGIEMVYVNGGPFYVGDGASVGALYDATDAGGTQSALIGTNPVTVKSNVTGYPVTVTPYDDDKLINTGILIDGDNGIDTSGTVAVNNPDFPTGYKAFYCMKYEVSQEQYVDFLNTLTRQQQDKCTNVLRDASSSQVSINPFLMSNIRKVEVENRNGIFAVNTANDETSPLTFYCNLDTTGTNIDLLNQATDGQNVGCDLTGWLHTMSYADWAALRPMTELEYEKACRGPETPVASEFAWHTNSLYGYSEGPYYFTDFGGPNEYPTNPSTGTKGNAAWQYTTGHKDQNPDRIDAPVRTGIFATSTTNRVLSGASYYGIMELSGNLNERFVTIGDGLGRKFRGTNGDGVLATSPTEQIGNATNADWPGISINQETYGSTLIRNGSGYRGGDWNDGSGRLQVSDRYIAACDIFGPNIGSGFRCVRTAE